MKNSSSITRRRAIAAATAAPLGLMWGARSARAQDAKPNIVYIMADDLGYADLSCYGRREYRTPNIDSLAASGVKFLQAYANSSVCSATRTALITGRYQYRLRWPDHIKPRSISDQVAITMDWVPTLLAAGGAQADPVYPLDGMSLLPALTQNAAPVPRKLFWRYRYNAQRAVRDGDMKWLKINENTFLFNLVEDPLERANLKDRQPEVYQRLAAGYEAWSKTMLPEDPNANTTAFYDDELADHPGNKRK